MKKLLISLLLLAGNFCIAASPPSPSLTEKVAAMSEQGRQKFVAMLLKQSGKECGEVSRTFYQGSLEDSSLWNVRCSARQDYAIVFYNDAASTTRVMNCSELSALGAPSCFNKLPRR